MKIKKPNRLINEKSPYLQQHAFNPVDWYPWSEEAFEKAKKECKPIFLSIGYSTCHWCHVMEKESFEDEEIARILNKYFVPIKVDREERPDVDSLYMNVCMIMTGRGGWPLTIIMTPDKKPFFAGTYLPKESSYTRLGLKDLLLNIAKIWKKDKNSLIERSDKVLKHLKEYVSAKSEADIDLKQTIDETYHGLEDRYDDIFGGFGKRPKFPTPHNFMFLLRFYKRTGNKNALKMVEHSLRRMRLGGVYDHIGFGFHRYSTDERWFLPHFEKMLYDQAMLMMAYTETFLETKDRFYLDVANEIYEYVKRDMTSKEGGFYSAEDADSEGEEGKFYVWSYNELKNILGEDFYLFKKIFPVTEIGNYREEATGKQTGKNIIFMEKEFQQLSKELNVPQKELKEKIENMRKKLFNYRERRIHPLKDTKILTDWNGLMITAISKLAIATGNKEQLNTAKKAADFILSTMKNKDRSLFHRYKDGEVKFRGTLTDYAYLIWGLLELYRVEYEDKYLIEAKTLLDKAIELFWDKEKGGFFTTDESAIDIIIRQKEVYDGAIPSGNSVLLYSMIILGRLLGIPEYEKLAQKQIKAFSSEISNIPFAYTMFMIGIDLFVNGSKEVVIVGEEKKFEEALNKDFRPFTFVLKKTENIEKIAPFMKNMKQINNEPTAYVCENFACKEPVSSISEFEKIIN